MDNEENKKHKYNIAEIIELIFLILFVLSLICVGGFASVGGKPLVICIIVLLFSLFWITAGTQFFRKILHLPLNPYGLSISFLGKDIYTKSSISETAELEEEELKKLVRTYFTALATKDLVGQRGIAETDITENTGIVKIGNENYLAKAIIEDYIFKDTEVEVVEVRNNTVFIEEVYE